VKSIWLGFAAISLLASGCGKHSDYLYYLSQKEPNAHYDVNVKEIHSAGGIDILWVIDNSGSMSDHQQNVIRNTGLFLQDFLAKRISWKMGLLSTDILDAPFVGFKRPFDNTDPDPTLTFQTAVTKLGTMGDPEERTFDPILKAFQNYPDFLRVNTPLAVLVVTDATEQSAIDATTFVQRLRALIGSRDLYVYPVLAATDIAPPGGCIASGETSFAYSGSSYETFAKAAKISHAYSICDSDFGTNLGKIGNEIVSQIFHPEIRLGKRPKASTLRVLYHGNPLPSGKPEDGGMWYYDQDRNAIAFYSLDFAKGDTEAVTIDYSPDDGLPDSAPAPIPYPQFQNRSSFSEASRALDPSWFEYDFNLESTHDYPDGGSAFPAIVVEGAKKMKLYFSRINTEKGYDYVRIHDASGNLVESFDGDYPDGAWSDEIEGDRCAVSLEADGSENRWGFAVTKIAVSY
jgi:hypothetical protein